MQIIIKGNHQEIGKVLGELERLCDWGDELKNEPGVEVYRKLLRKGLRRVVDGTGLIVDVEA